jgi:anti-sigma factor RsiW
LELCAFSTSGQLSEEEQNRLKQHLAVCPACREALREYESIVNDTIPAIGAEQSSRIDPGPGFSQSKAEKAFFERLAKEERKKTSAEKKNGVPSAFRRVLPIAPESTWRHVWMLYAAGILLFVTLCLSAYWVGVRHGADVAKSVPPVPTANQPQVAAQTPASLEEQLSDAAHEREIAQAQIVQRDKTLANLRRQLQQQAAEINRLKEAQNGLQADLQSDKAGKQDLIQQRTDLGQKLEAAQVESQALQQKVASLTQQSTSEAAQAKALGAKVDDLTRLLQDREASLNQQDELLAHDRDVREVMGARNLYIAEVYDTDEKGATRKPYGRLFYTKEKSVIFYAYDLDQQAGKHAQTFQAWGRRGPDFKQALNLGIFYEDNASKKRWVLKLDDPKTLAQIDAVFVTVEPRGGSEKPSGKPLLFSYLRVNPNHP